MSVRFWVLVLVAAITAGILVVVWSTWDTGTRKRVAPPQKKSENATVPSPSLLSEADVDISAEGIELTQGESGRLEWTLKAVRGDYAQESGRIYLTRPDMVYFMGEDRTEVRVRAGTGNVAQNEDLVALEDNVTAHYGEFTVLAGTLDYMGRNKSLRLGDDVRVSRPGMRFNASVVDVDVSTRDILAVGGVAAVLEESMFQSDEPVENMTALNATVAGNATTAGEDREESPVRRSRVPVMSLDKLFPSERTREMRKVTNLKDLVVPRNDTGEAALDENTTQSAQ